MSRIEDRLELFRGQIEELQGKMQRALGQLEGPRGIPTMLAGQSLEMRGRARQAMARARMGAAELSETIRKHPESLVPYVGLFALGVTVASLAIFRPQTLSRIWDWIQRPITQMARAGTEMGAGAGPGPQMGPPTGFRP